LTIDCKSQALNGKLDEMYDEYVEMEEEDTKPGLGVPVKRGTHPHAVIDYEKQCVYETKM